MQLRTALLSVGFGLFVAATISAQKPSFATQTYPNNNLWNQWGGANGHLRADLNGDGREDFVSIADTTAFNPGCMGLFAVALSTGDGSYAAPVCYSIPAGRAAQFAAGDFHHNGTMDLAVANDLGDLYIYQNSGNGTLTLVTSITLNGAAWGLVAAEVNHDGLVDLVYSTVASDGSGALNVLLGNIDGTFTTGPVSPFSTTPLYSGALSLADLDGDSRPDIFVNYRVYYGDGTGRFVPGPAAPLPFAVYEPVELDSDGTMELIGAPSGYLDNPKVFYKYLDIEWGHYNRTLTSQHVPLKSCTPTYYTPQVADFDGDGVADILVVEGADCQGNGPYTLNFMKGLGKGTFAPEQVVYSSSDLIFEMDVLRASHSSKPDLTLYLEQWSPSLGQYINPQQAVLVNTTTGDFPACTPPGFEATGISVCGPKSVLVSSPVNFSFAASNGVPGRDMEIWVDGKKVAENLKNTYTYHDFVQASVPLANGSHRVDLFSVGWDYTGLWDSFDLLVGEATCPIPSTGLNICSPIPLGFLDSDQMISPVPVYATANSSGGISRMEIWVDGVKKYSTWGSQVLKTQVAVPPGWHHFDYIVIGMDGSRFGRTVWVEVK